MSADEELRSLAARCPRSLLESFLIEKIRAQEAPTLDDLRTAWKKSRPQAWSSSALFEWLPEGLFPEILSRLDARRMGLVARTCRAFAESVVVASELRAAHLCLRLPTSAEQSVLRHLWFAERVGVTGLAWEVCAAPVIAEHAAGDYLPSIIVRHIKSGLMMILDTTSNGWVDLTIRGLERHVLSDCAESSLETMDIQPHPEILEAAYVPLLDYLHARQPELQGHHDAHWGFYVGDRCQVHLVNPEDTAAGQSEHADILASVMRDEPACPDHHILNETGAYHLCLAYPPYSRIVYNADYIATAIRAVAEGDN